MALKLNERYPGRFNNPSAEYPQGSFKNRTTPGAKDGSYLEKDWANDKEGFFQSLLSKSGYVANGLVDKVGSSQYYDALVKTIKDKAEVAWAKVTGTPTTLSGYGITDGATKKDLNNFLPKTGGALSGRITLNNGTNDSPEVSWENPSCTANLDLIGSVLRVFAERGGETVFPLQLDAATKVPYFFGNVAWHSGNFNPAAYLQIAQLPRNTSGPGWWRCGDTGIIRQWVKISVGDIINKMTRSVSWPVQFPSQCSSIVATWVTASTDIVSGTFAVKDKDAWGVVFSFCEWEGIQQAADLSLFVEAVGY